MSYGYYRAFNTMLDHVQVLHDMALKAAKGNRFKELKKGTSACLFVYNYIGSTMFSKFPLLENIFLAYMYMCNVLKLGKCTCRNGWYRFQYMYKNVAPSLLPSLCKLPDE